jgi:hypothetical protein
MGEDEPRVEIRRSAAAHALFALLYLLLLPLAVWDPVGGLFLLCALIWHAWAAMSRRPLIVLDRQGLRDRRLGFHLLPWADLLRLDPEARGWGVENRGVCLHFRRGVPIFLPREPRPGDVYPTRVVDIPLFATDTAPAELIEHVKRFAPHVTIGTSSSAELSPKEKADA